MAKAFYSVTVTRVVCETITVEDVEAENADDAEWLAIEIAKDESPRRWRVMDDEYTIDSVEQTGEVEEEENDPMEDFNYVGSRHHY